MTIKFISRKSLSPCGTFVDEPALIPNCTATANAKKKNEKL